LGINHQSFLIR